MGFYNRGGSTPLRFFHTLSLESENSCHCGGINTPVNPSSSLSPFIVAITFNDLVIIGIKSLKTKPEKFVKLDVGFQKCKWI